MVHWAILKRSLPISRYFLVENEISQTFPKVVPHIFDGTENRKMHTRVYIRLICCSWQKLVLIVILAEWLCHVIHRAILQRSLKVPRYFLVVYKIPQIIFRSCSTHFWWYWGQKNACQSLNSVSLLLRTKSSLSVLLAIYQNICAPIYLWAVYYCLIW